MVSHHIYPDTLQTRCLPLLQAHNLHVGGPPKTSSTQSFYICICVRVNCQTEIQTTQSDKVFSWGCLGFCLVFYSFCTPCYFIFTIGTTNQNCEVKTTSSFPLDSSIHLLLPAMFVLEGKQKRTGKSYLSAVGINFSNTELALATCCAISWIWPNDGPHSNQAQTRRRNLAEERWLHQVTALKNKKHTVLLDCRHLFSRGGDAVMSCCLTAHWQKLHLWEMHHETHTVYHMVNSKKWKHCSGSHRQHP